MSNTSVHNMETFLIKLKEEYCVYEHMLALCMQERQCIAQGDWHELRKSLGKRNVLLADVVRIEEEITELQLKEEWGTYREEASAPLKDEILSLLIDRGLFTSCL